MKYKIIQAEHQSWGIEPCEDKNCLNVHLWLNKRFGADIYSFSFFKPKIWNYADYCCPKEICIPENGIIKYITSKLEENNDCYEVDGEIMNKIFKGGYKKHLPLFQF